MVTQIHTPKPLVPPEFPLPTVSNIHVELDEDLKIYRHPRDNRTLYSIIEQAIEEIKKAIVRSFSKHQVELGLRHGDDIITILRASFRDFSVNLTPNIEMTCKRIVSTLWNWRDLLEEALVSKWICKINVPFTDGYEYKDMIVALIYYKDNGFLLKIRPKWYYDRRGWIEL